MKDTGFILEHEILKVLYIRTSFYRAGYPMGSGKTIIIGKRDYKDATLYFGTLVDILNRPEKYNHDALKSLQGMNRVMEEINTEKYNYQQVSNAIELLEYNGQVVDNIIEDMPGKQAGSRKITLTKKGAIDYRNNFYFKESETEEINTIKNTVTRIEHSLKKHWFRNELIKYGATAILGAAIALISAQIGRKQTKQPEKQLMITGDTIIVK